MFAFEEKSVDWWLDVRAVLDMNNIKDAKELGDRLGQKQTMDAASRNTKFCLSKILGQSDRPKAEVRTTEDWIKGVPDHPYGLKPSTPLKPPKPTIGRIVHYITKNGNELPAIIVAISGFTPDQWVYLRAFVWSQYVEDISDFAMYNGENKKAVRTWHWPEREREE